MTKKSISYVAVIVCASLFSMPGGCERAGTQGNSDSSVKEGVAMKAHLQGLLDDLAAIGEQHDEIYDTDVKEQMAEAVWDGFIAPKSGYVLPDEFGMFSAEGNSAVKAALAKYIKSANETAAERGLRTSKERLDVFQDIEVALSVDGQTYDEFFGHLDTP